MSTTITNGADNSNAFSAALSSYIDSISLAVDNPKKIAELTAQFIRTNFPSSVQTAYWITLSHSRDRDKGIAVDISKLPWSLRFKAVIGGWSGGFGAFSQPYDVTKLKAKFSIGVGAVIAYDHLSDLRPFVGFTVKL